MNAAVVPTAHSSPIPIQPLPIEGPVPLHLLVIDNDRFVREACKEAAAALGYHTIATGSAEQAFWLVDSESVDVVILDLNLPGAGGLEVLRQLKRMQPDIEVIVTSGNGTVQTAVHAMKAGAYDFLAKPFGLNDLKLFLEGVADHLTVKVENRRLCDEMKSNHGFANIIGHTPEMDKLYRIIGKAAHSTHPVLILGETGTGKEMVAQAIHYSGPFRDKPFVPVDCGSLVPTLIESELFGHVKGAFTGASHAKDGLLALAEGGTVFLDEIGELPLDVQSKLLRALQEKEIRPIGSTRQLPINARIVAATNRDLERAVGQGEFRRDLYFRLNVLNLRIPPLRERRQDVPLLVNTFLERLSRASGRVLGVSDDVIKVLIAYDWPGNVRELENCIERCCAMNSGPVIHTTDLPTSITGVRARFSGVSSETRIMRIADLEKQAIFGAIETLGGDKLMAAKLLGIGKTTLYRKLKEYQSIS